MRAASPENPLRVLFSACLLGHQTGWEGDAYMDALCVRISKLPTVKACYFCQEHVVLGTPRPLTTLYEGAGVAAAMLMRAGIPVVGQRDGAMLGQLLAELGEERMEGVDFVDQEWYRGYFKGG
jgi:uncharacterized protein YbbK (DUF523 family)